ncbi:hypothetical protein DID80_06300 [Candidatus Marinamargulisbacteria bacterium SCGC AAA071-K20]|nr:hypothetical protein DID80_06300 [Candidatus Marinamargulisbacteria bacterium SCGC AAA071-K20]
MKRLLFFSISILFTLCSLSYAIPASVLDNITANDIQAFRSQKQTQSKSTVKNKKQIKDIEQEANNNAQENNNNEINKEKLPKLSQTEKLFFELEIKRKPEIEIPETLISTFKTPTTNKKEQKKGSSIIVHPERVPYKYEKIQDNISNSEKNELLKKEMTIEIESTKKEIHTSYLLQNKHKIVYQFGYDYFNSEVNIEEENPNLIPINQNYLLGPGDKLLIRIWGKIEEEFQTPIDKNGNIYIPRIGHINLNDVKFKDVKKVIKKALNKHYVNFEVSITIAELKSITVYVIGNVKRPGSYEISSLSSAINALYKAGGPTKQGSLRSIKLNQQNKDSKTIDLYDYLIYGNNNNYITLKDQDTIFVPPLGNVVKITGQVKRPGIYEISKNTPLDKAISSFSGGFSINANTNIQSISRETKRGRTMIDIKNPSKTKLLNGDIINIKESNYIHTNVVSIKGNVFSEGTFQYSKNMTLSDLINKAQGMKKNTATNYIELYRFRSDLNRKVMILNSEKDKNFKLEPLDVININNKNILTKRESVFVDGAVQNPGYYYLFDEMTTYDLVILAKLKPSAELNQVELFRNDNGLEALFKIDLNKIINKPSESLNISLVANDHLFIRSKTNANRFNKIILTGQVHYPGTYLARDDESLESIINRAGGLTKKAFPQGARFYREATKQIEASGRKKVLEEERKRLIFDDKRIDSVTAQNQDVYERAIKFLEEKVKESKGRITINLKDIISKRTTLLIENGDTLHIPKTPATVQVVGGVQQPTAIVYENTKSTSFYIKQSGGLTSYANKKKIYIFKANGSITLNKSYVEKGDTIYVPEKIKRRVNWLAVSTSITQVLFNTITSLKLTGIIP